MTVIIYHLLLLRELKAGEKEKLRKYVYPVLKSILSVCQQMRLKILNLKRYFIRHLGYKLAKYRSYIGQGSLYLNAQKTLFNPPLPFAYIDKTKNHDRIIKGTKISFNRGSGS